VTTPPPTIVGGGAAAGALPGEGEGEGSVTSGATLAGSGRPKSVQRGATASSRSARRRPQWSEPGSTAAAVPLGPRSTRRKTLTKEAGRGAPAASAHVTLRAE
jgi:hypothetical protein